MMSKKGSTSKKPTGGKTKTKQAKNFCLLRWICAETVSVLPETTVRPGQKVYTGAIAEFKFAGTFYEAEVLKVSGECSHTLLDL